MHYRRLLYPPAGSSQTGTCRTCPQTYCQCGTAYLSVNLTHHTGIQAVCHPTVHLLSVNRSMYRYALLRLLSYQRKILSTGKRRGIKIISAGHISVIGHRDRFSLLHMRLSFILACKKLLCKLYHNLLLLSIVFLHFLFFRNFYIFYFFVKNIRIN